MSTPKLDPMRALESLTPGGSEFVGDPERCVAEIRYHREMQHKVIVDFKKRLDAAEAKLSRIRTLLSSIESVLRKHPDFNLSDPDFLEMQLTRYANKVITELAEEAERKVHGCGLDGCKETQWYQVAAWLRAKAEEI